VIAVIATILVVKSATPAIPVFDVKTECDNALSVPNCLEAEHASLGALRYWWPKIKPYDVKLACIRSVSDVHYLRYTHLMRCIAEVSHLPHPELASR
jgi:hypothetical protein